MLLQGGGHAVTTTSDLGQARAKDAEQLLTAARHGWVLVTHNAAHYTVLHEAWRLWSRAWQVTPFHAGILILPHGEPHILAREIGAFLASGLPLTSELYSWQRHGGWRRHA